MPMTANNSATKFNLAKTALLLLHWQNDIATLGGKLAHDTPRRLAEAQTIENTKAVLEIARKRKMLIIYVNGAHRPDYPEVPAQSAPLFTRLMAVGGLIRGTWGAEVITQLKPLEGEIVVYNYSSSSFCYTELDMILRSKGITDLVLTGLATNWAVESTARDGANIGYFIHTLSDCCLGMNDDMHHWTLTNILPMLGSVLDSKAFIKAVEG
jgi:nicotinamidase-related amidase